VKSTFWFFLSFISLIIFTCSSSQNARNRESDQSSIREVLINDRSQYTVSKTIYGKASYYAEKFHGRKTASGEIYDMNKNTAAHRTLPFGTICRITNLTNNKTVLVRINDRGPFIPGRILDLSKGAAQTIGGISQGIMEVMIEILEIPQ
jgi:rare lipoprotein A